jgi:HlyD family type I secretion membrane fusion protein
MLKLPYSASSPAVAQRRTAACGYALIVLTFGVMGGWAAVAPLDRAVVAQGIVVIEDNRKVVQHFEGGIVKEILVKEGQSVSKGELLVKLSPVQAGSNLDTIRNQLDSALALEASLAAERAGRGDVEIPEELLARRSGSPVLAKVIEDQKRQFDERRRSRVAQVTLIEAKIHQFQTETEGIAVEKASTEKQISFIDDELSGLLDLQAKGLVPVSRVLAMQRERTRLEGIVGRAVADTAKAANGMNEAHLQISQLEQKFQEDVSAQLLDVRQKINLANEKLVVAQDMLARLDIRAPQGGTVQGLKVFTIGQVVRAGDSLMEIVPGKEALVVHAQLPVNVIEHLNVGQTAEIRFPAFHSRRLPIITGKLTSVSRDRLVDEVSKQPYFLGIINLSEATIDQAYRDKLVAGMQADVVIATGERTALQYLMSPLSDSLNSSFRD